MISERILVARPHASDVRSFRAWLKAGRVVRKGEKSIKIVVPVMGGDDGSKVVIITPADVFDVPALPSMGTSRSAMGAHPARLRGGVARPTIIL